MYLAEKEIYKDEGWDLIFCTTKVKYLLDTALGSFNVLVMYINHEKPFSESSLIEKGGNLVSGITEETYISLKTDVL